jgi:hypothetical protein
VLSRRRVAAGEAQDVVGVESAIGSVAQVGDGVESSSASDSRAHERSVLGRDHVDLGAGAQAVALAQLERDRDLSLDLIRALHHR